MLSVCHNNLLSGMAQKGHEEANARPMFCPQTLKAQYVAFCRGHFSLYICLASFSLGGWGGVGEWEVWGEKHEKEELRHRSVL